MRATRKAIVTDASNGLLGSGCTQGMGQMTDARNLHPGCTQPLNHLADEIMGMYQLDTFSENADVDDEEKHERMSTWVNSLTI